MTFESLFHFKLFYDSMVEVFATENENVCNCVSKTYEIKPKRLAVIIVNNCQAKFSFYKITR